jgi:CDGSH-type Zn-finger protein
MGAMADEKTAYRIKINDNGPYLVEGGVPLTRRTPAKSIYGEPLEWDPVGAEVEETPVAEPYELCRCGQSANKPYCDKSHTQQGFDCELTADRGPTAGRRRVFQGTGVTMTDDASLCADAGFCGTRYIKVWKMIKRTDNPEVRARLLRMVAHCPSGRLVASLGDDGPLEPEYVPSIAAVENGPLWVRGGIPIEAPDGFVYEVRNRVTLCRCGQSKNKPFCDGSHSRTGFKAP